MARSRCVCRVFRAPLVLAVVIGALACQPAASPFPDPVPQGTALRAAVEEYFAFRRLAIMRHDAEIVWARYPELRSGMDRERGVNVEALAVTTSASSDLTDLLYDLEAYAPLAAALRDGDGVVRVHGTELYESRRGDSGGEFVLDLFMHDDGDRWTVTKSDEMTLSEYHDHQRQH